MAFISLDSRLTSSLEKPLITDNVEDHPALSAVTVLRGERLSFQLLLKPHYDVYSATDTFTVSVSRPDVTVRQVQSVFADLPTYGTDPSRGTIDLLESPTGLYPDVLEPLDGGNRIHPLCDRLTALWLEVTPTEAGTLPLTVTVSLGEEILASHTLTAKVLPPELPASSLLFTQWFHCDCLASYYGVPVFSEEHWRILEAYMRCAVRHGITCLLTPVLTPPLDTEIGGERPTVQLVAVTKEGDTYTFDFSRLKRYLDLARSCGFHAFEIAHFFTQWGAAFAPKVVATVEGEEKRIFGWDTPGTEGEYPRFLNALLPELVAFLREEGVLESCLFHVSDEPSEDHLEGYAKAKAILTPHLQGCRLVDALSSVVFYRRGVVDEPIPATNHIEPFLQEDIDFRWAYYCCCQHDRVGNRFIAFPAFRNRILGVQLYKFNIRGFLQWGYNFYYSKGSRRLINPYINQSGDGWVPSGDPFSVYPGPNGEPLASTRLAVFYEALQDREALLLCESLVGREKVVALIDELAGQPVTFADYPRDNGYFLTLREKLAGLMEGAL